MDRIKLKELAKTQISGNIGIIFLMYLIIYLIVAVLSVIPAVGLVLGTVAGFIFEMQMVIIFLGLTREERPEVSNLFDILKNQRLCGNSILMYLLMAVFTYLWTLLFIVPGIIKGLSYAMAPYIMAENEYYMTPNDAIKESMRIMEGHKMELFIIYLSFIGWILLSILTCGLLLIYVEPYMQTTLANFYNAIKDKPQETIITE